MHVARQLRRLFQSFLDLRLVGHIHFRALPLLGKSASFGSTTAFSSCITMLLLFGDSGLVAFTFASESSSGSICDDNDERTSSVDVSIDGEK